MFSWLVHFLHLNGGDNPDLPPGTPPTYKFEGPWFTTQLSLAGSIGVFSFLIFSYGRTRWPLSFAPRTKLKGFSPHEAHSHQAFFGWILPTLRTSEFTVLQIVGLDAAVLLNFFKMSFYLFSVCSFFAIAVLMPINWKNNIGLADGGEDDDTDWPDLMSAKEPGSPPIPQPPKDWLDLLTEANSYLSVHLIFTYLFTLLALRFTYKNYRRFIRSRQLFSLELVHSIPGRTVMVTSLPVHLRGERPLAEYFEGMGLSVESVSVCREVDSLKDLLDKRTKRLLALENAWTDYLGNPSVVETEGSSDLEPSTLEGQTGRRVVPHRKRPTIRPRWLKPKVDALQYLEAEFEKADEAVKVRRKKKFRATEAAFVTFEKMSDAQIAIQVAHAPGPYQCSTYPAPEPRDIVWANMTPSQMNIRTRDVLVMGSMAVLLFFWIFPITALASLLSYNEIKKVMPWLGNLIDKNDSIRAIVQNSLPSVAMITLNALLPFILEALTYVQGYRARSWIEYSLMKKYFLFLLINVVFIFLFATTYWQLVRDLANSPAKVPEKLAMALQAGTARHFFLSYVILQGLGIMPLQLLNLGVIIPRIVFRMFWTRTPRDFAELNAPPMINYGVVYPQAILVFVIVILYSVVQPLIVIFGAIYFGVAYTVYKYKLLFVFYKPYESQGQAWPITFIRLIWGVIIFLVFMIGMFILKKAYIMSSLLGPLLIGTVAWSWYVDRTLRPLSMHVSLSSVCEVERGEGTAEVMRLREGHPVTWSQSNLSRRRYAQHDDTLYVAPADERTDYSQPPMANWYPGVLNTGKRRYVHPALNGVLPQPWLPLKKGQSLVNSTMRSNNGEDSSPAVVLTLHKRHSVVRRGINRWQSQPTGTLVDVQSSEEPPMNMVAASGSWGEDGRSHSLQRSRSEPQQHHLSHRMSFDVASGVMVLPEDSWIDEPDSDEDYGTPTPPSAESSAYNMEESTASLQPPHVSPSRTSRYGTYFHHPERRRPMIPGEFPS